MEVDRDIMVAAGEAEMLLNNPLLKAAFSSVRESLVQSIEDNPVTNDLQRDKIMLSLQLLRSVKESLIAYIETGKINNTIQEGY